MADVLLGFALGALSVWFWPKGFHPVPGYLLCGVGFHRWRPTRWLSMIPDDPGMTCSRCYCGQKAGE